jgi:manganese/iron transport system ATP-binding protein/manganese/zinc/iron transport system ATP- binding protein
VTGAPLIEVRGLSGGYAPGEAAIAGVDFALERGQTLAVLGPNGGGKTTLFRALLGELPFREGRVEVPAIAYVPQTERSRLDFPVDALDVALMGTYGSVPWYRRVGREQREAALAALERVGLADRAGVRFGELSGGQRQRVLIARALAQGAEALLLDEPLSGVDRPSAERILAILDELRGSGRAIVLSTHDIEQARSFDRVLCLHRSQIAFGPPDALTADALARTYGSELIVLGDGERAVVVQHHDHEH